MLQQAGKQFGFEVEDSRTFCLDELRISSTAIREALAKDDLQHSENLLGKPYRIFGRVIHGNKIRANHWFSYREMFAYIAK